jgi:glucose/arabinose dehydrogenase
MVGVRVSGLLGLILLCFSFLGCESVTKLSGDRNVAATGMRVDKSGYAYDPDDKSCDGFPRLKVETAPGTCLGLVLARDRAIDTASKKEFVMPRTILQVPNSDEFLVVDMGGWKKDNGAIFRLAKNSRGEYALSLLKFPLNNPHGFALGPDGKFYIGEKQTISRFNYQGGKIVNWELVVGGLPGRDGHMHPLAQFVFDPRNGDLYINAGAPSDHCTVEVQGKSDYRVCPDEGGTGMASIVRIPASLIAKPGKGGVKFYEISARGLRNSMAMAIHPSGVLVQGENSRDFPELDEPYEELNIVDLDETKRGLHYGWPYCYNFHAVSPEWKYKENASSATYKLFKTPVDCSVTSPKEVGEYQAPHALIPPHAAPLSALYYKGQMFDRELAGKLLMTWHGYQPTGHRLVAYDVDATGRPVLNRNGVAATFSFDHKGACSSQKPYKPQGGIVQSAVYQELISKWDAVKGVRAKGAPVGMTVASDGSIWIVEDRENRTIVRLARTQNATYQEKCQPFVADSGSAHGVTLAWRNAIRSNPELDRGYQAVQGKLISKYCASCHGKVSDTEVADDRFSNLDFLVKNQWVLAKNLEESKAYQSITHAVTAPPMPPGGSPQFFGTAEGEQIAKAFASWINALPTDVESRVALTTLPSVRRVRNQPSTNGTVCGQLEVGRTVSFDPRPESMITADGWKWARVYLEKKHTALFDKACAWPEDGVFYMASQKAQ